MATPEKLIKNILKKIRQKNNKTYNKNNCLKGISRADVKTALHLIFDNIKMEIYQGHYFVLRGFGYFDIVQYKARKARNPKTGETIDLPIQHRVKFKAGKTFNYRINRKYREQKWNEQKQSPK